MKHFVFEHHNFWQRPKANSSLQEADVVFMWADWPFKREVDSLRAMGKKVVVYEHGFGSLWDYERNNREPMADGYLALGESSRESLIRVGVDPERILVAGNPVYDDIRKHVPHEGKKRALYVALHWMCDVSLYNQRIFNELLKAYPQYDWTVKLVDKSGELPTAEKTWYNAVESEDILKDIKEKLPDYDVVFTPNTSTFESFARLMGIPVWTISDESYRGSNDPKRHPMPNNFVTIGQELPEETPIQIDMDQHIKRPSVDFNTILDWTKTL